MPQFRRGVVASLAFLAIGSDAGSVMRQPVHLRADADSIDAPWKAALEASITHFVGPAPVSAVAQAKDVKGDEKEKKKASKMDQPVQVQVPDAEMKNFIGLLSTGCGGRFEQMLAGKGGDLHKFGSHGAKADEASCTQLEGSLCATKAHIIHAKKGNSNGRTMESSTDVAGNSCLPKQCTSGADLNQISQFMHTQAKNIIPGAEHRVELHVDCSKSGGASADVGVTKSGSIAVAPTAFALVAVMAMSRFAIQ